MKQLSILISFLFSFQLFAQNPEKIVQIQFDAYNRQDLKAFVATYRDTVEFYSFGNLKPRILTHADLEKQYGDMFKKYPENKAALHGQIIQGNYVIYQEFITGRGSEPFSATLIYLVEKGLIWKVWSLR